MKSNDMRRYKVVTTEGPIEFIGKHLKDRETENWHYYETEDGDIIHFRKQHMVLVAEQAMDGKIIS